MTAIELPHYDAADLSARTPEQLIDLLIENEDRVSRNLIDECARRGDAMVDALARWVTDAIPWEHAGHGYWWLRLHTLLILGLIPGEQSGNLMLKLIHGLIDEDEEDIQDWLSGSWPALMRNKPQSIVEQIRVLCADKATPWYTRVNILDVVLDAAQRAGPAALDEELDWAAAIAADESDNWDMRMLTAMNLLDFPRARHHPLLETLAAQQSGLGSSFTQVDIELDYARNTDQPSWLRHENPWRFYEPEAIEQRQQRWAGEDARDANDDTEDDGIGWGLPVVPYTRDTPKIGRNDPCPCGSGKKYKKCCFK